MTIKMFENFADQIVVFLISREFNFADGHKPNILRDLISRIVLRSAKCNPHKI